MWSFILKGRRPFFSKNGRHFFLRCHNMEARVGASESPMCRLPCFFLGGRTIGGATVLFLVVPFFSVFGGTKARLGEPRFSVFGGSTF